MNAPSNEKRNRELLVATFNAGKLREIRELLGDLLSENRIELRSLTDFPAVREVAETGKSFAENALLKARGYAAQTNLRTLADDSGLEVEILQGAPGIYSARYGGTQLDDAGRRALLLEVLRDVPMEKRRARFVCVIALFDPQTATFELTQGVCAGRIAMEARGANGFGYDPVFIPDGYEQTFGELPDETKRRISQRAGAMAKARAFLLRS